MTGGDSKRATECAGLAQAGFYTFLLATGQERIRESIPDPNGQQGDPYPKIVREHCSPTTLPSLTRQKTGSACCSFQPRILTLGRRGRKRERCFGLPELLCQTDCMVVLSYDPYTKCVWNTWLIFHKCIPHMNNMQHIHLPEVWSRWTDWNFRTLILKYLVSFICQYNNIELLIYTKARSDAGIWSFWNALSKQKNQPPLRSATLQFFSTNEFPRICGTL